MRSLVASRGIVRHRRRSSLARSVAGAWFPDPTAAILFAAAIALAAMMAPALAGDDVGSTSVVIRTVNVEAEGGVRRVGPGESVHQSDVIATADASASEIVFRDDTVVAVGPNSRLTLDRFVFDRDPALARFAMTTSKGVFRFSSGNLASESYVIRTPTVTIGVTGTAGRGAREGVRLANCWLTTTAYPDGRILPPGPPPDWAVTSVKGLDGLLAQAEAGTPGGKRRASTRCDLR